MIRGLILDMDGTLLDSKQFHLKAWRLLLKKYNLQKSDAEILSHFGKTTEEIAKNIFPPHFDPKKLEIEKDNIFFSLISEISPFQGVPELLSRLKQKNYRICIASSNPKKTIQAICVNCNFEIDVVIGVEDVLHGKPAPDMILAAASQLNIPISECLAVGDTIYDIQAAKAAHCKVAAVLTGSQPLEILKLENPDFILPSILHLEMLLEK